MKPLTISDVRKRLPEIVDEVARSKVKVVVTRHGKPVASIVPFEAGRTRADRYPLRGHSIAMAADFDEPAMNLWEALSVAEREKSYGRKARRRGKKR